MRMSKGLLPYHGLGSGIQRALKFWPHIEFVDDRGGCLFTARVFRQIMRNGLAEKEIMAEEMTQMPPDGQNLANYPPIAGGKEDIMWRKSGDLAIKILSQIQQNSVITTGEIAENLGVGVRSVERSIAKLKQSGRLKRVGGRKAGYWQVENP